MQRKGWQQPGWHEVIELEDKNLSPIDLLILYVRLTSTRPLVGDLFYLSLKKVHTPLLRNGSTNRIH